MAARIRIDHAEVERCDRSRRGEDGVYWDRYWVVVAHVIEGRTRKDYCLQFWQADDPEVAERLAERVRERGTIDPDLWTVTSVVGLDDIPEWADPAFADPRHPRFTEFN